MPSIDRVRFLEAPREIVSAALVDTDGAAFGLQNLRGKVTFVFFGFTHCPDVCPVAMQKFRQVGESGKLDDDDVAYVLISVDGERDSPEAMAEFLGNYSAKIVGLTGDPALVRKISKDFSASFFKGNRVGESGDYTVSHSPQAFLLDVHGRLRAELYNASVDSMVDAARFLLSETS